MLDSEDDLLSNNASSHQSVSTTIYAKGPNNEIFREMNLSNDFLSSTRNIQPFNIGQRKYGAFNYDQQSLYYRRGGSSMSQTSKLQNFASHNFYPHCSGPSHRSNQQSVYNGRSGSSVSVRSIDSSASMTATDIALAFKNVNYNKNDVRLIKEAYNKFLKNRFRRKVEKRRNHKLFLKKIRQKCGDDSGDLGSDSSISSDDCKSTRTASYKENISNYRLKQDVVMNQRTVINESNLYKDCSEDLRQNYLRNVLGNDPVSSSALTTERACLLKDRFKKGFPFPAQRFSNGPQSSIEPKSSKIKDRQLLNKDKQVINHLSSEVESEEEEIFSEITTIEKNLNNSKQSQKRFNDIDKLHTNPSKKYKRPKIQLQNELNCEPDYDNKDKSNFVFVKPQTPVSKSSKEKKKNSNPDILISKSHQPLLHDEEFGNRKLYLKSQSSHTSTKQTEMNEKLQKETDNNFESVKENQSSDDVSMRPSFIKRKLFTQKLDIAENRNLSNTSQSNSPHIKCSANNNREKNKIRKLASSQSCLNREVLTEGNQIMDLIQKIVPSDQMVVTNATNQSEPGKRNSQPNDNDKWDITSVISTCNTNEFSDTYTDEEIFNPAKKTENKCKNNSNKVQSIHNTNCSVVIKKLPQDLTTTTKSIVITKEPIVNNVIRKVDAKKETNLPRKSFWDTDFESDFENNESLPRNLNHMKINSVIKTSDDIGARSTNNNTNGKKTEKVEVSLITTQSKPKRTVIMKTTTQTSIKKGNSKTAEKENKTTRRQKKDAHGPDRNNLNLSNRSLRSNSCVRNIEKEEKPNKNMNTVTLINHRVLRPKRLEKKNRHNNTTPDVSDKMNISIKSLRSWHSKEFNK